MQARGEAEPRGGDADCQRASVALARGDLPAAARAYRKAIRRGTRNPDAYNNLGAIVAGERDWDGAVALFERALALATNGIDARRNLASALAARGLERHAAGRRDEAIRDLRASLEHDPDAPRTAADLAAVLVGAGRMAEAAQWCRHALGLAPDFAPAHVNLATALLQMGDVAGALEHSAEARRLAPDRADYHSGHLHALNYDAAQSPAALAAEHHRFGVALARAAPQGPLVRRPRAGRLRVGYLSPDLRRHSVAFFFEPLLRAHDRRAVEVTCYADNTACDEVTGRLRLLAEHWRPVSELTDTALAELVRDDGIDVLVDLAGHTGGNRLPLFARRAAPLQVTYLGYPATTGLATMDLRITDAIADPVGMTEPFHSERLARIEGGFLCYAPPLPVGEGPEVAPPPCLASGRVTFGSFNALMKVNDRVLDAWAVLLHRVPGSRLLLKAPALREAAARERILIGLEARRVARESVELLPPVPDLAGHLAAYAQVDVALDTFPYNGTTTTCEALWMGVPVVTFAGHAHAGRVGASILSRLGLDALSAASVEDSIAVAMALASDPDALRDLRRTLRDRMLASPLMDSRRLAGQLEGVYAQASSSLAGALSMSGW